MVEENQLQTSMFINSETSNINQVRQPREFTTSVSARPLLTSTTSTAKSSTPRIQIIMRSLSTKALLVAALAIALIITLIIIVVLFAKPKPGSSSEESGIFSCTSQKSTLTADPTNICNVPISISKSCNQADSWGIYDVSHEGWDIAKKYLPPDNTYTSFVLSPAFEISSNIYSLEVQFSFSTDSQFTVYIVTLDHTILLPVLQGPCFVGIVADSIVLKESTLRIVIASSTTIYTAGASASIHTSPFRQFASLGIVPRVTSRPDFEIAKQGTQNLCTLEISNQRIVDCDWWIVDDVSTFEKRETHNCVGNGLQSRPGDTWFLALESPLKTAKALLISPIIERGEDRIVLFTIWHMMKCTQTKIRIFLVKSAQDVASITEHNNKPVVEIRNGSVDFAWQFQSFQIPVPQHFPTFQIVVEGFVAKDGNCSNFLCSSSRGSAFESDNPLLVLDDLAIEMQHNRCNLTGRQNLTMLDCRFQDSINSSTYCNWESSNDAPLHGDYFQDWKTDNSGDGQEILHGATNEHLDGRGHILSFDALGKAGDSGHFSSPLVTANSNCSCTMSFLYLLRGPLTPRLQVDLVIGVNTTDEGRTRFPQWSLYGHQSDDWQLARVVLNLNTNIPFQIEIVVKDIRDSRGDIHIDDLFFFHCVILSDISKDPLKPTISEGIKSKIYELRAIFSFEAFAQLPSTIFLWYLICFSLILE